METHAERKIIARKALRQAHDDGVSYEDVAKAIGVEAHSLRSFASLGKLGADKVVALIDWLVENNRIPTNRAAARHPKPMRTSS